LKERGRVFCRGGGGQKPKGATCSRGFVENTVQAGIVGKNGWCRRTHTKPRGGPKKKKKKKGEAKKKSMVVPVQGETGGKERCVLLNVGTSVFKKGGVRIPKLRKVRGHRLSSTQRPVNPTTKTIYWGGLDKGVQDHFTSGKRKSFWVR